MTATRRSSLVVALSARASGTKTGLWQSCGGATSALRLGGSAAPWQRCSSAAAVLWRRRGGFTAVKLRRHLIDGFAEALRQHGGGTAEALPRRCGIVVALRRRCGGSCVGRLVAGLLQFAGSLIDWLKVAWLSG